MDPYKPPQAGPPTGVNHSETPRSASADEVIRGWWYGLIIPAAIVYTFICRALAGPGYTNAPNQGAMVLFFFLCLAWPLVAIVVLWVIGRTTQARGIGASAIGLLCWIVSCFIPFWIGMA